MRAVVLALLLANLVFFGWAEWIDVPTPPPPSSIAGLRRLTLVSELPPAGRAALARKISLEAAPQCVSVGPFDDPAMAGKAAALLQAKRFEPRQRAAQSPAIRRFWVYLDGLGSDAAVMRVLHKLERGGVDDAEAMPPQATGGREISLGLFADRGRAESREKTVHAMGLEPRMDERMVPGTVYWLDLTLPSGSAPVPLKDVAGLEPAADRSPPISVQPCPASTAPVAAPEAQPAQAAPAPQAAVASPAAPPLPAGILPRCKPGGGGPVPCIASESRESTHPSVL